MALIGTTAFVTGASQGIGEAVALSLVEAGATKIALAARDANNLARVAAKIDKLGVEALPLTVDLGSTDEIFEVAARATEALGPIHILANCAGVTDRGDLFTTTPQVFDHIFAVNVRGNFFMMQAIAPSMIDAGGGVIINISSMLAHGGMTHLLPYSASKAALNLVTRNVGHALRKCRVRVHSINLGWTVTPAEHVTQTQVHGMPDDWATIEGAKQPFGRLLEASDAAGLCVFLASHEAQMMTGTSIDLEQWVSGVIDAE